MAAAASRSMAVLTPIATVILATTTVVLFAIGDRISLVTGIDSSPALTAPDEVPATAHLDPMPFLIARDTVEVRVDTAMTVRQFLDINRLNRPNLRQQVLAQLGNPPMTATIDAGTRFTLQLTPRATDVPATTTGAVR